MRKFIKIILFSLTLTPLLRDTSVLFPDSAGKIFFLRLILTLASLLFLAYFIFSQDFRGEIKKRAYLLIRHPLLISIFVFIFLFIISAIFAVDTYTAFWGDVQRGEGVVGMSFFLVLFVLYSIFFEKKDWLWFFKISLVVSLVLLGKEIFSFLGGAERPGSFIGNPTFLAGYLLFSIFSSLMVFKEEENKIWKYFSIVIIALSIFGILLTETRGAILGFILGFTGILLYGVFRGHAISYRNINFRKASAIILGILLIFCALFFVTRGASIWQKFPGLARVATINSGDISTRTRLFSIDSSLRAINPASNGVKKLLFGWGPNNYVLAFGKYYNLEQYKYEREWFDRAHNKILDVLVGNGIFALFASLGIWFFYFRYMFRRENSLEKAAFIFFGISFFIHLFFVFDNISTSIPFFAVMAFLVHLSSSRGEEDLSSRVERSSFIFGIFFTLTTLFLLFVFLRGDVPAYLQMKKYLSFKRETNTPVISQDLDAMFEPFTVAQRVIRQDFLISHYKEEAASFKGSEDLLQLAFAKGEEYLSRAPLDFRFFYDIGGSYTMRGKAQNSQEFIKKGEENFKVALSYAEERPDFRFGLAVNFAYQKRFSEAFKILDEIIEVDSNLADSYYYYGIILLIQGENNERALDYFEKSFDMKWDLFKDRRPETEIIYGNLIKGFYDRRDKGRFIRVAERLIKNKSRQSSALSQVMEYLKKEGVWPKIDFN